MLHTSDALTILRRELCSVSWNIAASIDQNQPWVRAVPIGIGEIPSQGWKLHVSATPSTAFETLCAALPVLDSLKLPFKVLAELSWLELLNAGSAGRSQIGKYLTVYTLNDQTFTDGAARLADALAAHRGPIVPSDRGVKGSDAVYYRYGSFTTHLMQTPMGTLHRSLQGPDGVAHPDVCTDKYSQPTWVQDPLARLGRSDHREPSRTISDRFVVIGPLAVGTRHLVQLAADVEQLRTCVVKRHKLPQLGEQASVARYRSGKEQAALIALDREDGIPRLRAAAFDENGPVTILDDTGGRTLEQWVRLRWAEARPPADVDVASLAIAVIDVLDRMHRRGYVHGDLKSANVIFGDDGAISLVDFELSDMVGQPKISFEQGTRGYRRELANSPTVTVQDDLSAFGSLMYFVATGSEPSQAPDLENLLSRPIEVLSPHLSKECAAGLTRIYRAGCSAKQARNWAESLMSSIARQEPACQPLEPPDSRNVKVRDAAARAVQRLGETLVRSWNRDTAWLSTHDPGKGKCLRHVDRGVAGGLLGVIALHEQSPTNETETVLQEGVAYLNAPGNWPFAPLPGLLVGEAGVSLTLLKVAIALGDDSLLQDAVRRSRQIAEIPCPSPDIYHGSAGQIILHLAVHAVTDERRDVELARAAGERIRQATQAAENTPTWVIPDGFGGLSGKSYLGYAHGTAGIIDSLARLVLVTGDASTEKMVRQGLTSLCDLAVWSGRSQQYALWSAGAEGGRLRTPFWCHGSAGIAQVLALGASRLGWNEFAECARGGAWATARLTRWANPTMCHGLAGNMLCLLAVASMLDDDALLDEALALVEILCSFVVRDDRSENWICQSETRDVITPDYAVGYAGVLAALAATAHIGKMSLKHPSTLVS